MRPALVAILGLAISVGAVIWLVLTVDLSATARVLADAAWLPLVSALGVIAAQLIVRGVRWRLLLPRKPSGERAQIHRVIPILLVGYLGNTLLPARLGELVRAYLVTVRENVSGAGALGSVVLERVLDVCTLAGIAFVAATVVAAPPWIVQTAAIAAGLGLVVLALLVSGVLVSVGGLIRLARLREAVVSFGRSAGRQPRRVLLMAIALSCVAWGLDAMTFFLVGKSLALNVTYPAALLIGAVTVLGTAIPSAPAYIGTFELSAVAAAKALGLPGDEALAMALAAHALTSVPMAVGGAISLAGMSLNLGVTIRRAQSSGPLG